MVGCRLPNQVPGGTFPYPVDPIGRLPLGVGAVAIPVLSRGISEVIPARPIAGCDSAREAAYGPLAVVSPALVEA